MKKIGFDNQKYLKEQTEFILQRASGETEKLYIECGGKLLHDFHAARVLPGYDPDVKMKVFSSLSDSIDVIICIHSKAIEQKKIRADLAHSYDQDVISMIDDFKKWNINANKVVITRFEGEESSLIFKDYLERRGIKVYLHKKTKGYPSDVNLIVSDEGYGANKYIQTDKKIVIVTAPGPGSGKLGTCLSQVYHEYKKGVKASYSKFETFPIWNLPIDHPVNIAYEAATSDLGDVNMIDHFYLSESGKVAVNYNRDLEAFPLVKRILEKINMSKEVYTSPTDMGVNRCGFGIIDDDCVKEASLQEIIRRYLLNKVSFAEGKINKDILVRSYEIMYKAGIKESDRAPVIPCREKLKSQIEKGKGKNGITCVGAIVMEDGTIITGTNSPLLHASTAMVFNAIKYLAKIDDNIKLIPQNIIKSVKYMKQNILRENGVSLNLSEGLVCLAIAAEKDEIAKKALKHLPLLSSLVAHLSHIPSEGDIKGLRVLNINVTSDDIFPSANLEEFNKKGL